jgi:hypothetical protein
VHHRKVLCSSLTPDVLSKYAAIDVKRSPRPLLHPASGLPSRCELQIGWQTRAVLPFASVLHGGYDADIQTFLICRLAWVEAGACRGGCGDAALRKQPAVGRSAALGPPPSTGTGCQGAIGTCCCSAIVSRCMGLCACTTTVCC